MNAQDFRSLQEAYMEVYASPEQLDEISQKLATKTYAERRTGEFEGDDSPERLAKTDKLENRIKKKFGEKAAAHADEAAAVKTFGRKDASGRRKQTPQPRIQKSDYRTTQDGKMHKQDQKELKTELRIKRDKRLRAARAADTNEQVDIYDIILSHLLDEGYADTQQAAEAIMVNMSEEWREEIMEGMTMKDFKANRKKNERRAASADAEKRGHVGKEWYNTGRKYSPDEAKRSRANMSNDERRARHSTAVDPDNEDHNDYSADKTKNAKKLRKQRAMGEH